MSGGGAAPAMKMSDVFILLGSDFFGQRIVYPWISPTNPSWYRRLNHLLTGHLC